MLEKNHSPGGQNVAGQIIAAQVSGNRRRCYGKARVSKDAELLPPGENSGFKVLSCKGKSDFDQKKRRVPKEAPFIAKLKRNNFNYCCASVGPLKTTLIATRRNHRSKKSN
eukprot:Gb_36535 [translate_table: standard]